MLKISNTVFLPLEEIEITAIRAQGAGGQNVNKVASAVHLRFHIPSSSLPDRYKEGLLALKDSRITKEGEIILKAQRYRSQEKNREDAFQRLQELISGVGVPLKKRRATAPSLSARKKRVESKVKHGRLKATRGKIESE